MNYRNVSQLNEDIRSWASTLPSDIDLIAAIPRSGLLAATLLCLHRNLPITDVEGLLQRRIWETGRRGREQLFRADPDRCCLKVLVLDDSVWSGASMREARQQLKPLSDQHEILYGAVYVRPGFEEEVDYYYQLVRIPRIFEWNVMHSWVMEQACVEIDGVLCRHPEKHENGDGPSYHQFLESVEPRWLPTRPIAKLVTCRFEKYRPLTEEWLARHGIEYGELIMMDYPTKAARRKANRHAEYKAEVYRSDPRMRLFIERLSSQAKRIASLSGKPALCADTQELFYPGLLPWTEPSRNALEHFFFEHDHYLRERYLWLRKLSAAFRRYASSKSGLRHLVGRAV